MGVYDALNQEQKEAVFCTEGPLLILAGAGSGKTRVITHRIAYLLEEKNVSPWNILAITFTNKAAKEMRERVDKLVGFGSEQIWISTFHSTCVRILRRYADRIGFDSRFAIYDADDQKTVLKDICKRLLLDSKYYKERMLMRAISEAKDALQSPSEYAKIASNDEREIVIANVYREYQDQLQRNNAMDFDDLICNTVKLFQTVPDVLAQYQERFRYICVDEYQDTNTAQFELVRLLAGRFHNLCVVGDDDQSIYKFRGANIHNILDFENHYPEAVSIRLEQNYRSTKNILDAANAVIRNNQGRKEKTLWTKREQGRSVRFREFESAQEEAEYIADTIIRKTRKGEAIFGDCAVLYRTNAQSRLIEEKMVHKGIPYEIVGGVNFYARREVKDLIAYLKTIANGQDELALSRIVNVPKRGIGTTTMDKVATYARKNTMTIFDAMRCAADIPDIKGNAVEKLRPFVTLIEEFREYAENHSIADLIMHILSGIGYHAYLMSDEEEDEAKDRIANLDELMNKAFLYEEESEEPSLTDFLEGIALVADIDRVNDDGNRVLLMTLHSSKGLEFPYVFLAGMEERIFPNDAAANDPLDLEEERRLAYVGITRAKEELTLTCARSRMIHGETVHNPVSRFVREIPGSILDLLPPVKMKIKDESPVDNRPKAILRPRATAKTDKPFIAQGISSLNLSMGVSKGSNLASTDTLSYQAGDRVSHVKYGEGVVTDIIKEQRDYKVTVHFDTVGQKIMFASFA
ncbi:MAG: DNA helicase PcrA, partial [Lachnospiraceae bacterium]|nr:DNA helicase PcrA [Lachnospiraceae bacterium]